MTSGVKTPDEIVLVFSAWTVWDDRRRLRRPKPSGGVYLLGYFASAGPVLSTPDASRLPYEVIYVGDAKNLNDRPLDKPHDKVRKRFAELFGSDAKSNLYVAVCPLYTVLRVPKEYACQRTRSFYVKSKLAWDYADLHKHPPVLQVKNTDQNRPWIRRAVATLKRSSGISLTKSS